MPYRHSEPLMSGIQDPISSSLMNFFKSRLSPLSRPLTLAGFLEVTANEINDPNPRTNWLAYSAQILQNSTQSWTQYRCGSV